MRLLLPVAWAALTATVALSATAAAPAAGTRSSSASPTQVSAAQVSAALASATQIRATQIRATQIRATRASAAQASAAPAIVAPVIAARPLSAEPALPSAAVHGTGTSTTTVTGVNTAAPNPIRVAPSGSFTWPLSPQPAVLSRFEQPLSQWSPGHRGVDLLAVVGQPALSAGDGIVAFSGVIAGRGVITVRHAGGLRTTFEPVDERLASGTVVHRGTRIGVVSLTPGHCVPRHCLHWGAISGQAYRDPLSLLGFGRPILLPLG